MNKYQLVLMAKLQMATNITSAAMAQGKF